LFAIRTRPASSGYAESIWRPKDFLRCASPTRGALSVGQSVVFADRLEPLARIVARIEEEAIEALDRLDRARGKAVRWTERNSPSQPSALMESD
jgi:hypothetical protein